MKITKCSLLQEKRLYCPSTGEVIYDPESGEINLLAEALIAAWQQEGITQPEINDDVLQVKWHQYFDYYYLDTGEDEHLLYQDILTSFLQQLDNSGWRVYECTLRSPGVLPHCCTVWCLVKADTALEKIAISEVFN